MKFYPLRNWRRGQRTVLIDGDRYYTLEGATNWNLDEKGEERVTLAAHKGEEWIKEREKSKNPIEIRASQGDKEWVKSPPGKEWVKSLLEKDTVYIVSPRSPEAQDTEAGWIKARQEREKEQEQRMKKEWVKSKLEQDETLLVAPTPSGHQDAGTIKVNPEARKQADKNKTEKEKTTTNTSRKGKGKAPRTGRNTPPVTRARKRARQANTAESRTASQDSYTPRNPLQDNGTPDVPHSGEPHGTIVDGEEYTSTQEAARIAEARTIIDGEGYTPPSTQEAARIAEARKARIQVDLIRLLLDADYPETKKTAQGILDLSR